MIPLADAEQQILAVVPPLAPRAFRSARCTRPRLAQDRDRGRTGAAIREIPGWTATRCVPRTHRAGYTLSAKLAAEPSHDSGRRGRGHSHHDRRADARRRRRGRDGRTNTVRRRRCRRRGGPVRRSRAVRCACHHGIRGVPYGNRAHAGPRRCAREPRLPRRDLPSPSVCGRDLDRRRAGRARSARTRPHP